jgi:hypothetical protein
LVKINLQARNASFDIWLAGCVLQQTNNPATGMRIEQEFLSESIFIPFEFLLRGRDLRSPFARARRSSGISLASFLLYENSSMLWPSKNKASDVSRILGGERHFMFLGLTMGCREVKFGRNLMSIHSRRKSIITVQGPKTE